LLHRGLVFDAQFDAIEQRGQRIGNLRLCEPVAASQHPLRLQQHEQADEHGFAAPGLAREQSLRACELHPVVLDQKAHQHVRIEPDHQRESLSTGIRF
jgi:hypothetical protein